jgi:hypothetical protein
MEPEWPKARWEKEEKWRSNAWLLLHGEVRAASGLAG